jgi:thiamine pyrophosphokinase
MPENQPRRQRALIFANGEQINLDAVRVMLRPEDYIVAADGGLHLIRRLGIEPDLVIGDLDSLELEEVEALKRSPIRVKQYPVHKDETDLELAVLTVIREGYQQVLILAALGGRLDMTLANIFLLGLPELANADVRLEDGLEEVFLIRPGQESSISGQPGDRVSLLPLGGPAQGIRTRGLYYPLRGETLYPERTRGISNQMLDSTAGVSLEDGVLICIHSRQASPD